MTHRNRDVYDRSHKILLLPVGAVVTAMDGGNAGNAGAVSGRPPGVSCDIRRDGLGFGITAETWSRCMTPLLPKKTCQFIVGAATFAAMIGVCDFVKERSYRS